MTYGALDASARKKQRDAIMQSGFKGECLLLGRSILGRDIDCYKIGEGKKNIVVVAAHHGLEYITSAAIYSFINFLSENLARGGRYLGVDIEFLLQRFTFWLVPCLNPDGVELHLKGVADGPLRERQMRMSGGDFSLWQANGRGVDLNHNYDYGFFEYKRIEEREKIFAGPTRYSGEYPESEPESKAMASLVRTLMPHLTVSLHTQGEEVFSMPRTHYGENIGKRAAQILGYSHQIPTGLSAFGGLSDYVGGVLELPSLTLELGKGKNPLPLSAERGISSRLQKLLILLPTAL